MKVYIETDLEGVAGMVYFDTHEMRAGDIANRKMLTRETNAAVEGAFEAGASQIVVNDDHGAGSNLLLEEMHPDLKFVLGKKTKLLEGIDESFDAIFFIGQHAMMNAYDGVLNHTFSAVGINRIWLNNAPMGELGLRIAIGAYYNVPTILVSGDTAAVKEAEDMLGHIEAVAVKESISRYCTISIHPVKAREMIKESAKKAITRLKDYSVYRLSPPYEIKIEYTFSDSALMSTNKIPGVKRLDERTISYQDDELPPTINILELAITEQAGVVKRIDQAITTS